VYLPDGSVAPIITQASFISLSPSSSCDAIYEMGSSLLKESELFCHGKFACAKFAVRLPSISGIWTSAAAMKVKSGQAFLYAPFTP
jgi:hypothetical protein